MEQQIEKPKDRQDRRTNDTTRSNEAAHRAARADKTTKHKGEQMIRKTTREKLWED